MRRQQPYLRVNGHQAPMSSKPATGLPWLVAPLLSCGHDDEGRLATGDAAAGLERCRSRQRLVTTPCWGREVGTAILSATHNLGLQKRKDKKGKPETVYTQGKSKPMFHFLHKFMQHEQCSAMKEQVTGRLQPGRIPRTLCGLPAVWCHDILEMTKLETENRLGVGKTGAGGR